MIEALLKRLPEKKARVGQRLIHALVVEFLYPRRRAHFRPITSTAPRRRKGRLVPPTSAPNARRAPGDSPPSASSKSSPAAGRTTSAPSPIYSPVLHHESNPELARQWDVRAFIPSIVVLYLFRSPFFQYAPLVDGTNVVGLYWTEKRRRDLLYEFGTAAVFHGTRRC